MEIEEMDKNLAVKPVESDDEFDYYDCCSDRLSLYGLKIFEGDNILRRMPSEKAALIGDIVEKQSKHSTGGRLIFKTNSKRIAVKVNIIQANKLPNMTVIGSVGFDLYRRENKKYTYISSFAPPMTVTHEFSSVVNTSTDKLTEYVIHFPLYSSLSGCLVGFEKGSTVMPGDGYGHEKPVVYYGSSITHGCSASRPGNAYENIISRMLDCDHINLGFSGNAKGEPAMAEYIATLDMSAFVMDYDHNALTVEYLQKTHEPFFKIIREKQPNLPIIMASRPDIAFGDRAEYDMKRRDVIKKTYDNAKAAGDNNVYFIDGSKIFDLFGGDENTVDHCHPNDTGFLCMAIKFAEVLKNII